MHNQFLENIIHISARCISCGLTKPAPDFPPEKRNASGISGMCRICTNKKHAEWREQNKSKIASYARAYKAKNPDKVRLNHQKADAVRRNKTLEKRGPGWGKRETPEGRRCSGCEKRLPNDRFYKKGANFSAYCKPCDRARSQAWRRKNKQKLRVTQKKSELKSKYGLTIEAFQSLAMAQGGKCAICRNQLGLDGAPSRNCCVDHDHATGNVRGILCRMCNIGLGNFKDNEVALAGAISYLRRSRGKE